MGVFSRTVKLRLTPLAGPATTYTLSGYTHMAIARPLYEPIMDNKEMIDRSIRQKAYGWRVRALIVLDVLPGSAEDTELALIHARLLDETETIEITLDGTIYREALLEEWEFSLWAEKNIGARYSMTFVCKDLLRRPQIPGPVEKEGPPAMQAW